MISQEKEKKTLYSPSSIFVFTSLGHIILIQLFLNNDLSGRPFFFGIPHQIIHDQLHCTSRVFIDVSTVYFRDFVDSLSNVIVTASFIEFRAVYDKTVVIVLVYNEDSRFCRFSVPYFRDTSFFLVFLWHIQLLTTLPEVFCILFCAVTS